MIDIGCFMIGILVVAIICGLATLAPEVHWQDEFEGEFED